VARAIQLGFAIVATFAAIRWSGLRLDILEAALMLASVVGIGMAVGRAEATGL
jgi:hypothetical protein